MDAVVQAAHVSVSRACAFCALGILCFMVGLSFDPRLSALAGGGLSLAVALGLMLKARLARHKPYKRTETWLILSIEDRPPAEIAQQVIASTLVQVFYFYARYAAVAAALLLAAGIMLSLLAR